MISPWIGFSLAVPGMYRPPHISSASSSGRIATRSASGKTLSRVFVAVAMMLSVCVLGTFLGPPNPLGERLMPPSSLVFVRSGVQQCLRRSDLHRDQVRLGRLLPRQRDRKHAQVASRLDLVRVDR